MLGTLALVVCWLLTACGSAARPAGSTAAVRVSDPGGQLRLGVTLAARAADSWENPAAVTSARRILSARPLLEAQSLMGWGVGNPEPAPGVYDWSDLDRRMGSIAATGGTPVLILAGAPDWMAGAPAGTTDWRKLGQAPTPAHYEDFAALAAAAARRYPQVRRVLVWNELTGFWDARTGSWNMAGYTQLFNEVAAALHSVNPAIEVGGPYVVMRTATGSPGSALAGAWGSVDPRALTALQYWLAHEQGAAFVAVDGDDQPSSGTPVADLVATGKFAAVDNWLKQRTALPIWWSEFYVEPTGADWSPQHQAAAVTQALVAIARSGAAAALLWGPEADGQGGLLPYLWSSAAGPGGGRPSPLAAVFAAFGTPGHTEVIVNTTGARQRWDGADLAPWQVELRP